MNHLTVASAHRQYLREVAAIQPQDFPSEDAIDKEVAADLAAALIQLSLRPFSDDDIISVGERALMEVFGGVDFCRDLMAWRVGGKTAPAAPPSIPESAEVPA